MQRNSLATIVLVSSLFAAASSKPFSSSLDLCTKNNGRFPNPSQCDAYVECTDGVPKEKLCPDGLLFNPEKRFNDPCGYPIDVDCGKRTERQPPQITKDCPHRYGYFPVDDNTHCGQYIQCDNGIGHRFNCSEGLAFNIDTYTCDWPDQVRDCKVEEFLDYTCPVANKNLDGQRLFKSKDCQHYFVCGENNKPRQLSCGEGQAFNENIRMCDDAKNVDGCRSVTKSQ